MDEIEPKPDIPEKQNGKQRKMPAHLWKKGQSGNPLGRPRKPEIELFRQAKAKVEKEKGISLYEHIIRTAYDNPAVAVRVLDKELPNKTEGGVGVAVTQGPKVVIFVESRDKDPVKVIDVEPAGPAEKEEGDLGNEG